MKKILIVFSLIFLTACSSTNDEQIENTNINDQYIQVEDYSDEHEDSAKKAFEEITINDMDNAPLVDNTADNNLLDKKEEVISTNDFTTDVTDTTEILVQDDVIEQADTIIPEPSIEEAITNTATISINCITALNSDIIEKILSLLPSNGVILSQTEVEITETDTAFDVLLKICKEQNIQIEYVNSPVYGSSYIESIGHLYEFDAGSLSGWTYRINGEFPNISSSSVNVKNGDKIEFLYTCDLGEDVKNV